MANSSPKQPDFDESADMRLVELQRAALGKTAPSRGTWESRLAGDISGIEVDPEGPQPLESAVVAVETTATPSADVIPGAIVTLTLSLVNEGAATAQNVRVAVPLPGGAAYRNGSFVRDGRPQLDDAADELFGPGALIASIAPRTRITFLWKIGVRLGNKPLVIAPAVDAERSAVVGAQPMIISRKAGAQSTSFAGDVQRYDRALYDAPAPKGELPFYELDEEETIEHEAAQAALSPVIPKTEYMPPMEPPLPGVPPPDQPEPIAPPGQPAPDPEPGVPTEEPSTPPPPEQPPDVEPAAQIREAVVLYGQLDRPSVTYFERIFSGNKPPTLLNHFILAGALACTRNAAGDDVGALKQHMDAQGQLLQRIVLHERLGKKEPIGEYTGTMLARVDQFVPAPVLSIEPPKDANTVLLSVELETPTLTLLQKMQSESDRLDFTKARQLTLALQARDVLANCDPERIETASKALRSYAQVASTQLQRFFVRMRIDRTTGLLFAHDETLDTAAQQLVAALVLLF